MNYKIKSIREKMKLLNLQGIIISNPINVRYVIGIPVEGIILMNDKENLFVTDARYMEEINNFFTINDELIVCDQKDMSEADEQGFFQYCETVGFEEDYVTYSQYQNFIRKYRIKSLEGMEGLIEKHRVIKCEREIENIKKACEITDNCFNHLVDFIKIGMTEKEVALEIQKFFIQNGADGEAFTSIVASGVNSAKPHAILTDKKIEYGDPIIIDFGAKYNGYCSDMTRTIFAGNVNQELRNIYNLILKNQLRVAKDIRDGMSAKMLSKSVDSEFYLYNYSLIHALGHGVGLEIHEIPYLTNNSQAILRENMVITNEPGIYINGKYGIRVEDTIRVGKEESEVLTKSNKEIIIVDKKEEL